VEESLGSIKYEQGALGISPREITQELVDGIVEGLRSAPEFALRDEDNGSEAGFGPATFGL
jgi:hypothetical protein